NLCLAGISFKSVMVPAPVSMLSPFFRSVSATCTLSTGCILMVLTCMVIVYKEIIIIDSKPFDYWPVLIQYWLPAFLCIRSSINIFCRLAEHETATQNCRDAAKQGLSG